MKNMAIVGGSLAFVAFGGGAYSLDARSRKSINGDRNLDRYGDSSFVGPGLTP